ncbi:MAG: DUF4287 domain-containing protein [Myxococcales bacterium]|nr:DUF4287 domain-containing protein [Myxococcales bacterium]
MSEPRLRAPVLPAGEKPKGPASYFPSIEARYGQPMQHWIDLVVERLDTERHMAVVAWLKETHQLGHGHANAIVAWVRSRLDGQVSAPATPRDP